jgi:hypothetical protein
LLDEPVWMVSESFPFNIAIFGICFILSKMKFSIYIKQLAPTHSTKRRKAKGDVLFTISVGVYP